ncbi:hypothetical protein DUNSADRAFT_21, partial [Dunaliella salina]
MYRASAAAARGSKDPSVSPRPLVTSAAAPGQMLRQRAASSKFSDTPLYYPVQASSSGAHRGRPSGSPASGGYGPPLQRQPGSPSTAGYDPPLQRQRSGSPGSTAGGYAAAPRESRLPAVRAYGPQLQRQRSGSPGSTAGGYAAVPRRSRSPAAGAYGPLLQRQRSGSPGSTAGGYAVAPRGSRSPAGADAYLDRPPGPAVEGPLRSASPSGGGYVRAAPRPRPPGSPGSKVSTSPGVDDPQQLEDTQRWEPPQRQTLLQRPPTRRAQEQQQQQQQQQQQMMMHMRRRQGFHAAPELMEQQQQMDLVTSRLQQQQQEGEQQQQWQLVRLDQQQRAEEEQQWQMEQLEQHRQEEEQLQWLLEQEEQQLQEELVIYPVERDMLHREGRQQPGQHAKLAPSDAQHRQLEQYPSRVDNMLFSESFTDQQQEEHRLFLQ